MNSPVATIGVARPNLLRFLRRLWCAWGLRQQNFGYFFASETFIIVSVFPISFKVLVTAAVLFLPNEQSHTAMPHIFSGALGPVIGGHQALYGMGKKAAKKDWVYKRCHKPNNNTGTMCHVWVATSTEPVILVIMLKMREKISSQAKERVHTMHHTDFPVKYHFNNNTWTKSHSHVPCLQCSLRACHRGSPYPSWVREESSTEGWSAQNASHFNNNTGTVWHALKIATGPVIGAIKPFMGWGRNLIRTEG